MYILQWCLFIFFLWRLLLNFILFLELITLTFFRNELDRYTGLHRNLLQLFLRSVNHIDGCYSSMKYVLKYYIFKVLKLSFLEHINAVENIEKCPVAAYGGTSPPGKPRGRHPFKYRQGPFINSLLTQGLNIF